MILPNEDVIQTNLKNSQFDKNLKLLSQRYLKKVYSSYMLFSFENLQTKERLVFNTDPCWYQTFIDKKLIDDCPLYAATSYANKQSSQGTSFYLWNQIIPEGVKQKRVVGLRKEHDIGNGLSFSRQTKQYQIILALATNTKDHELESKYKEVWPTIITLFTQASNLCFSRFNHFSNV